MGGGALLAAGKIKQRACGAQLWCTHVLNSHRTSLIASSLCYWYTFSFLSFSFFLSYWYTPTATASLLTSDLACAAPNLCAAVCHISSKKCRRRWMTACGSLPPAPLPPACACFALAPRYRQLALIQLSCIMFAAVQR